MECALRSHDVERAANHRAVGTQPAPLVERFLTSLCGAWWPEPSRPQALCALADECRAPRKAVATAPGEGVCFGWSCPRATRARSRRYVLRPPCLWHVLQSRLRSASLDRDAAGERWSIIHFRIMGSPNIYLENSKRCWSPLASHAITRMGGGPT